MAVTHMVVVMKNKDKIMNIEFGKDMIQRSPSQIGLVINAQSFVDVITNSSSELFICNSDKSITLVEDILRDMLDKFNKENSCNYGYNDCFGDISIIKNMEDASKIDYFDGMPATYEDALDIKRKDIFCDEFRKNNPELFKALNKKPGGYFEATEKAMEYANNQLLRIKREQKLSELNNDKPNMPYWWKTGIVNKKNRNDDWDGSHHFDYIEKYFNKLLIFSKEDNSIPYELFDDIQDVFSAERLHLG